MHCAIHNIEKTLFKGEIKSINLPTKNGEITILENHLPMITQTLPGIVHLLDASGTVSTITINAPGFLEVLPKNEGVVFLLSSNS